MQESITALEDQLHKQYAENENSRGSVLINFLVGIIALFGGYGYVLVNIGVTSNLGSYKIDVSHFFLVSIVVSGIFCFLALLALCLGYSLRRDQYVIHNIREKRYGKDSDSFKKIFGKTYSPKDKKFCDFIPDFYNLFYCLFFVSQVFIFLVSLCVFSKTGSELKPVLCVTIIIQAAFFVLSFAARCCCFKKYKDLFLEEGNCKKLGKEISLLQKRVEKLELLLKKNKAFAVFVKKPCCFNRRKTLSVIKKRRKRVKQ